MQKLLFGILVLVTMLVVGSIAGRQHISAKPTPVVPSPSAAADTPTPSLSASAGFPLAISTMAKKTYPGSNLTVEQTLSDGSNSHRYVVSYMSDRLKIYGLLTVPIGQKPQNGWPVIVINHGYIPPAEYSTLNSYAIAVDPLAAAEYMVFKPDYRGNGNSQGTPTQVYISSDYVTDSMNAIASIKKYPDANPNDIGIWAHSMGGNVTLHEMVLPAAVKAVDIWSGVVGNYTDILAWWNKRVATGVLTTQNDQQTAQLVNQFVTEHHTPQTNPDFWNSIDPTTFLANVSVPVLLQVGTADQVVPPSFSTSLYQSLKNNGKNVHIVTYPGADHNLSPDAASAMEASVAFFNKNLQ